MSVLKVNKLQCEQERGGPPIAGNQVQHDCIAMDEDHLIRIWLDYGWTWCFGWGDVCEKFAKLVDENDLSGAAVIKFFQKYPQLDMVLVHYKPLKWF